MSNQDHQSIFDTIVRHARKQRRKSMKEITTIAFKTKIICAYRTPEGLSCFAGCLIKDEFYNPAFETRACTMPEVESALILSGIPEHAIRLVRSMQAVHDHEAPQEWEAGFSEIASQYGLTITEPTDESPLLSARV